MTLDEILWTDCLALHCELIGIHYLVSCVYHFIFVMALCRNSENSTKNHLLVLRSLANIFSQPLGVEVMDVHRVTVTIGINCHYLCIKFNYLHLYRYLPIC